MKYLGITEVADKLQVANATAAKIVEQPDFPKPYKFAKTRRWLESEIDSWVESRRGAVANEK